MDGLREVTNKVGLNTPAGRDQHVPGNHRGAKCVGLYPEVSRTKLAQITGRHISTITGILKGRTRCTLELAVVIAQSIGVKVERLNRDLSRKQVEYRRVKVRVNDKRAE